MSKLHAFSTTLLLFICFVVYGQPKTEQPSLQLPSNLVRRVLDGPLTENDIRKKIVDSFINIRTLVRNDLNSLFSVPLNFRSLQIANEGNFNQSYFGGTALFNHFNASAELSLLGIPVQAVYNHSLFNTLTNASYTFSYDKNNYLSGLKKKLADKLDYKSFLSSIPNPADVLRQSAEQVLKAELGRLNTSYGGLLNNVVGGLDLNSLFTRDIQSLKQQFLNPEALAAITRNESLLQELRTRINLGEAVDTAQYGSLERTVMQFRGIKALVEKIEATKNSWESSGLLSLLKESDLLRKEKLKQVLDDPGMILKMAKQQLNLNSIQRFFLKLNSLKMGQNSLSASPLTFNGYLNNGLVTEFLNNGKAIMGFLGKAEANRSVLDLPFSNSGFVNSTARALQFERSNSASEKMGVALMSFSQGLSSPGLSAAAANFRRSFVTSFNKEFALGKYGSATAEVSRSVGNYNIGSGDNAGISEALKLFSAENLYSNLAFAITYRDEFPEAGLNYQLKINKTGIGYDNPGSTYLNSGSQALAVSARKKLFENKVLLSLRSDIKEFSYSESNDNKWRSFYSMIDARLKLRKGQFISFRYLPSAMQRLDASGRHRVSNFSRLSADGNFSNKILKHNYNSYFSVAWQENRYVLNNSWAGNTSLGMVLNQNLQIKKQVFYWNTNLSRAAENSQFAYFNSSFNSDLGTTYNLFGVMQASSSVGYNSISGWYRQLGIRQTLSMQLKESFVLDLFIDARKNLALYQPLWFGTTTGSLNFRYILNK